MKKIIVICLLMSMACSSDIVAPDEERMGYDFFPLSLGRSHIYHVENIQYQANGDVIESAYEMKTEVVDSFRNQEGSLSYIVHYFERMSETDSWEIIKARTAKINARQGILVEENIPYLKLSFPVEAGKTWNGNVLNSLGTDIYQIDSINNLYITPAQDSLTETLTVVQENNGDFISQQDRRYEIYARNVGLVYKEDIKLNYCTENNCLGQQVVESGHEYRQYLIAGN